MLVMMSIPEVGRYGLSAGCHAVHSFEYNTVLIDDKAVQTFSLCLSASEPSPMNSEGTATDDNIGLRMIPR